jgi:hypothetical protein
MWEASTGIVLILVVTLGIGLLFGPSKKKHRSRSREYEMSGQVSGQSVARENPYDETIMNANEAAQAALGASNKFVSTQQKYAPSRQRKNEQREKES